MEVLFFLLPLSLLMSIGGLVSYIWAIRSGQLEDLSTQGERILVEPNEKSSKKKNRVIT